MSINHFRTWMKKLSVKLLSSESRRARGLRSLAANDIANKNVRLVVETLESRIVPAPVVGVNTTAPLVATAITLTIAGSGFSTTVSEDTITFDSNVSGSVIAATNSNLTVSVTGLANVAAGTSLGASATVNGESSGAPVEIGFVVPGITSSSKNTTDSSTAITINGGGFSTTPGNDTVVFNDGLSGTVSSATATQLTVTVTSLPTALGSLTATVTTNNQSSAANVQVGTEVNGTWTVTAATGAGGSFANGVFSNVSLPYAINTLSLIGASTTSGDTIAFQSGLGTITLPATQTVSHNLTISGSATVVPSSTTTTSGFVISAGKNVAIAGLTFSSFGGNVSTVTLNGGAIKNAGNLSLTNVTFTNNVVNHNPANNNSGQGGAIFNSGSLTLNNVLLSHNVAYSGGGIFNNAAGTIAIIGTQNAFTTNSGTTRGGALANYGNLNLNYLTFNNNNDNSTGSGNGGGVYNQGTLTLSNSQFTGNSAGSGGGIYNIANLTLANDVFTSNMATAANSSVNGGGAIFNNQSSILTINNSTFMLNSAGDDGGAIFVGLSSAVTIRNSYFKSNSAGVDGGAIAVTSSSSNLTLSYSTLANNVAGVGQAGFGGGIYNSGVLAVNNTLIVSNTALGTSTTTGGGGGIYNLTDGTFPASLTLNDSTIYGNTTGRSGGGVYTNGGSVNISNSTLSNNKVYSTSTNQGGGAIWTSNSTLTLQNDTIANNVVGKIGGGIYAATISGSTLNIFNTIIAGNSATGTATGPDIDVTSANTVIQQSNGNLFTTKPAGQGVSGVSGYTLGSASFATTSPVDNGGPREAIGSALGTGNTFLQTTLTLALLPASIAIGQAGAVTTVDSSDSVAATDNTIIVANTGVSINPGSYILIDQEEMLVIAFDPTTNTLTVTRGAYGTTAAQHDPGTAIYLGTDERGTLRNNMGSYVEDIGAYQTIGPLAVQSAIASSNGIVLVFSEALNPESTVLYSSPGDTELGAADVAVTGPDNTLLRGSLVIDPTNPNMATFVQTSGLLAAGTYTVTIGTRVTAASGDVLLGNYISTVTVAAVTTPVLSVPSFARGPGQPVALGSSAGIPISISNATGVTQANFTLTFDPLLLTIGSSGALTLSPGALAAGLAIQSYNITSLDSTHSVLNVSLSGGTGLTAGTTPAPLLTILATVPTTAPYLNKSLLSLGNVMVNFATATGESGVDVAAFLGDVLGAGSINATDASLVSQVGSGSGTGFSNYKDLDPSIIGGIDGSLAVNANDASLINQAGSGSQISAIPSLPVGITLKFGGPDPYLYLSAVQGSAGQTVTEILYLDVTDPNGIQLTALDEAIGFDATTALISNVRNAEGLSGIGSYLTASTVDNTSGVLLVGQAFIGSGLPPVVPFGTKVAVLQFDVTLAADTAVGSVTNLTLLQQGTINGFTKFTAISSNEGALTFTPGMEPSNSGNPAIDGSVTVVSPVAPNAVESTESTESAQSPPELIQPKLIQPVRRVISVVNLAVSTSSITSASGNIGKQSVINEVVQPGLETLVVNDFSPLITTVLSGQPEANPLTVAPEVVQSASGMATTTKVADSAAALSLVTIATSRNLPVSSTGTTTVKPLTAGLDEMYRQIFTGSQQVNEWWDLRLAGDNNPEELPDAWYLENGLMDRGVE